jgi:hypothetical protein
MRGMLTALCAATLLAGLTSQGIAEEPALLNCRLMKETTPWLFRQHCKSENFVRLAVSAPDDQKKPKKHNKYIYKKDIYLEKKLYTELRECKSYKCKLIMKSKLARFYSDPTHSGVSSSGFASNTLGTASNTLSTASNSLGGALNNTVSGTANNIGGVARSASGMVSGATSTVGGLLK